VLIVHWRNTSIAGNIVVQQVKCICETVLLNSLVSINTQKFQFFRCDVAGRLVSLRSPFVNDVLSVVVRMLEETSKSCGKHSQEHCQVNTSFFYVH
jgi:hypothetical protein